MSNASDESVLASVSTRAKVRMRKGYILRSGQLVNYKVVFSPRLSVKGMHH